ncbi:MAG: heme ABC exporter ATP-binding protein CcmA [Rhodospirillales bacterium]|nr:heme ABC exporter ATP-binding protein CcmA [Rhodospirillales bacterium]
MTLFAGHDLACRRGERLVFSGLSFRLAAGAALLLRGPNGSGKSSLLRCMAGLLAPVAGVQTWNEQPLAHDVDAHRARLRYLGHQDAVKPALTVLENLALWQQLHGLRDAAAIGRALAGLGLDRLAGLPARLLSAGQRRRVALARLLASPAPLWLLDEPTTALDDDGVERFARMVAEHRAGGGLVVLSSHGDPGVTGEVLALADFAPRLEGAA